ncbi:MAG: bifunctional pyr operon transcriptional regulator/uracil phosphoribosyltransferase PyrR [Candidatus Dormibacteria bacterium]|jgi:pyrimidine operon attenuation protein/uracil phosphoribosyltransferase
MTQLERAAAARTDEPAWARTRVLDWSEVGRVLTRLAHEIVEGHPGDLDRVVIAAIREGGVPVARGLCAHLRAISGNEPTLVALDVSGFRDDRPRQPGLDGSWQRIRPEAGRKRSGPAPSPEGAVVILVDDVIQTGRTMRAAFDAVASQGRPAAIEMGVLVDRGGREVPVRPNYVGKNLPVAASEWVEIALDAGPDPDGRGVFLVPRP